MRFTLAAPLAIACLLSTAASCGGNPQAEPAPQFSTVTLPSPTPATSATAKASAPPPQPAKPPSWPTPEDCVSYNPSNLTKYYEAGYHVVLDGSKQVIRAPGGPGESVGEQALALAKRFRKHCYLGRKNTREERFSYIFDYWRDATASKPSIPDENCSSYNPGNLTVEDMGGSAGWRVKEHDHVLHLFDNGAEARNGRLVLGKYHQICFIGQGGDETQGQDLTTYFK